MSSKAEKAGQSFSQGLTCSQSVFAAFCRSYGLDEATALKLACSFGAGVRHGGVCGAATGAVMAIGLKYGNKDSADKEGKALCDAKTGEFLNAFRQRHGHLDCVDIMGCDITTEAGQKEAKEKNLRSSLCLDIVKRTVESLEAAGY